MHAKIIGNRYLCSQIRSSPTQEFHFVICLCSLQLNMKNYTFDGRHKPTFVEEDITNVHPIVKHTSPRATDAYQFYTSGQAKVQQGNSILLMFLRQQMM